jgi:hypothetical protein
MLRLFRAGLVAALIQFVAVGLETLVALLSARRGLIVPASLDVSSDSDSQSDAIFPLLTWVYLLTALGGFWCISGRLPRRMAAHTTVPGQPEPGPTAV